jgi:ribonuclease P protein subunit RPR2
MMTVKGSLKPANIKQIAKQRIDTLLSQAEEVGKADPKLAAQYVSLARKVAMAARISLPPNVKRHICKNCNTLFIQGFNCRVRLQQRREPHIVVTCLNCGYNQRLPLRRKEGFKVEQNNNSNETPC